MKDNYDDLFGTMYDFDGDGHSDITETYMAYRMMTDDENDDSDTYNSKSVVQHRATGGSGKFYLAVILIVLSIIGWIYFIVTQIVSCSSSSNKSSYSYSHSHSYKSYSGSSSKSNSSANSYHSKTESSSVQSTTKKSTYKSYSSKSSKSADEYNAKDYADADDFYYDHYDDFYDYEDAEDYYNDHYNDR